MPNHCYNRVNVYSDKPEVIKEIHDIFENGTNPYKSETVFGQIIPEPDWKNVPLAENDVQEYSWDKPRGEKGELPVVKDVGFGEGLVFASTDKQDDRWYNWRVANWGTKWDCYDLTIESDDEHEVSFSFNTAWSPPEEICRALKDKYEADASIQWFYDEPGMEFAGYL